MERVSDQGIVFECLCQDCLRAVMSCDPAQETCTCGGDICACAGCTETLKKLRQGETSAKVLGTLHDVPAWSEFYGVAVDLTKGRDTSAIMAIR